MKNQLLTLLLFVFSVTQSFSQSGFTIEKDSTDTVYSYDFAPIVTLGDSFYWTFGDGDSSFVALASHTYDALGNYEVCLTDLDTADTTVYCDSVIIECLEVSADIQETHAGYVYYFESNAQNASAYIWDFGDGSPLDSTADPVHFFPWLPPYDSIQCIFEISLTAYNFCDTTIDRYTVTWEPCNWSVSEFESTSRIVISPNPSNSHISLNSEERFVLTSIKSINGQVVMSDFEKTLTSQKEIDVSALPNGVYLLEYEMDQLINTQRFIVHH